MQREININNEKELEVVFHFMVEKATDFYVRNWGKASGYLGYDAEVVDEFGDVYYTSCIDSPMALPPRGEKSNEEFFATLKNWAKSVIDPEAETITSPLKITFWDNQKDTYWRH